MMASMTAREYKEWEAYERATGPLDSAYEREMMAQLHELTQMNNILTGASLTKKGKKNPAGKFRKAPRAEQIWLPDEDEGPEEIEDEDDDLDPDEIDSMGSNQYKDQDTGEYDPAKDPFASMPG